MRLACLLLVIFFFSSFAEEDELRVEVLYKPRVCLRKSQFDNMLKVQYKVFFQNGTLFHSSYDNDVIMRVPLGLGHPSSFIETGFNGMCVGERRLLTIQHHGQGDRDLPLQNGNVIPANTPLLYEVELIDLEEKINVKQTFENIDSDGDNYITLEEIIEYIKNIEHQSGDLALSPEVLHEVFNSLITEADNDKDGKISREEYRDTLPFHFREELVPGSRPTAYATKHTMLLLKCVILWSALCFIGTSGQFFQDEVYVEVQEFPEECVAVARENDIFLVHYRAYLPGDILFFSSHYNKRPVVLLPDGDKETLGLRRGILGMCVGEVRILTVPPELAYGGQEFATKDGYIIPADSEIIYEVELLLTKDSENMGDTFDAIDTNMDGYLDREEIRYQLAILEAEPVAMNLGLDSEDAIANLYESMFKNNDKDLDGRISRDEYLGAISRAEEL
ncbi:peptidyl-prolyl cis-trans isomerase FKBP10-like [Ostrea edulis]|uniref:peptidyl-prolyl cis-trans isomerase FKBP10-like n=1 Tax=Ostrea edulis TaxID=37623 RepID=UPI0024AFA60F|nr:peptidyl-prolyl cis-trans isomerase FKBP10-like [Ostrea edulis]